MQIVFDAVFPVFAVIFIGFLCARRDILGAVATESLRDCLKSRPGGRLSAIFGAPVLTYFKYAPLRCSKITPIRLTGTTFQAVS